MPPIEKTCQNCQTAFAIEPEDTAFYEKMDVPPPTWCPNCRLIRRMVFTNERNLYQATCGLCSKKMISMFPADAPFPVYCRSCCWSDNWDPLEYGRDFDESRPFLEQFAELRNRVPRYGLLQAGTNEKSEYCNRASTNKNCYLCFRSTLNEDCMYSHFIVESRDCLDGLNIQKSELAYECIDCLGCYKVMFSQESQNCSNSAFLYDCRDCVDCFGCVGLRNKQYHIFNEPYSKENYAKKISELYDGTYASVQTMRQKVAELALQFIRPSIVSTRGENVSGNWVYESTNANHAYMSRGVENGKYLFFIIEAKDCMDYFHFGRACERIYEVGNCGLSCSNMKFNHETITSCSDVEYCDGCSNISSCFGSAGLHNFKHCILNKQYSEKDYEQLVAKIKKHMADMPYKDKAGREYKYGEFFPPELSPVAYNETPAQEFFPLTKKEAIKAGYVWADPVDRKLNITLQAADLPENISDADDSITKQIIACEHAGKCTDQCTEAFKILPLELKYYKRMNVPLPRLCPNCRHYERLRKRTPITLHPRVCACAGKNSDNKVYKNQTEHFHKDSACPNKFETTYAPDRPEIVYCEECYKAEVT